MYLLKNIACFFLAIGTLLISMQTLAQGTIYIEGNLGSIGAPDTTFISTSNDLPSICDEFINPNAPNIDQCVFLDGATSGGWQSHYTGTRGISGGGEFGFHISRNARVGISIALGSIAFDQTVNSSDASGVDLEKLVGEIAVGTESIENANTRELFFWLYGDLPLWRYWILSGGLGIGASNHGYEISWDWTRHDDPALIETGSNQPNAEEIKKNLAGTFSRGSYEIKDRLFGFGVHTSVARSINSTTIVGLKASWRKYVEFNSPPFAAGVLRGHEINLRKDGSQPVATWSDTQDTDRSNVEFFVRRYF